MESTALLESEGQAEASLYPLWFLHVQEDLARRRINQALKSHAIVMQAVIMAARGSGKKGEAAKLLKETLESLDG